MRWREGDRLRVHCMCVRVRVRACVRANACDVRARFIACDMRHWQCKRPRHTAHTAHTSSCASGRPRPSRRSRAAARADVCTRDDTAGGCRCAATCGRAAWCCRCLRRACSRRRLLRTSPRRSRRSTWPSSTAGARARACRLGAWDGARSAGRRTRSRTRIALVRFLRALQLRVHLDLRRQQLRGAGHGAHPAVRRAHARAAQARQE